MAALCCGSVPEAKGVRDQILEAANHCFRRYGVAKTTIDDVAEAAGVSRATLYRYVEGGRDELVLTVMLAEARRQISPIVDKALRLPTLTEQLAEIGSEALVVIRKDEQLSLLFSPESVGIGSNHPEAETVIVSGALDVFGPFFADARENDEIRADITDAEIAEWLIRNTISLLTIGGEASRTKASVRRYFERFVIPPLLTPAG